MVAHVLASFTWRKSSYSSDAANCVEVGSVTWCKSSYSSGQGANCVEVAEAGPVVGVRDSKDPEGGVLVVEPAAWRSFLRVL